MMKNTFNAMLKNRPKENDEQNAIDFILAEYKGISDGIVIDDTVDIGWPPAMKNTSDNAIIRSFIQSSTV